mmetsp:Transcript_28599/g.69595  ORF Transcript_28599/g.69595 Transcript_28599/m.69595 type:complete len:315 (+) Transcript_28599:902-1846(+)
MHCSATKGLKSDDVVLFCGLSGTGKTTLSADPHRLLIGDDEHVWDDEGIFNIEGGCYAKVINISPTAEADICAAIRKNAILENVICDEHGVPDYSDNTKTENTRCSYPLEHIKNYDASRVGTHPHAIVFLTCDVFGVLPPVARLTSDQAKYHFMSGYTSKMSGTERGVTAPQLTFSHCFGAAFMPLRAEVYANLLAEKMQVHGTQVYLVNTGWTFGSYGTGKRMSIKVSRAIVDAITCGRIHDTELNPPDPIFQLRTPKQVPGVPDLLLNPRKAWSSEWLYEETALKVAKLFQENWTTKGYDPQLAACGPKPTH